MVSNRCLWAPLCLAHKHLLLTMVDLLSDLLGNPSHMLLGIALWLEGCGRIPTIIFGVPALSKQDYWFVSSRSGFWVAISIIRFIPNEWDSLIGPLGPNVPAVIGLNFHKNFCEFNYQPYLKTMVDLFWCLIRKSKSHVARQRKHCTMVRRFWTGRGSHSH